MRKVLVVQFALLMLVISIMTSCTKSSPVGSELLAGDQANIQFTDTLSSRMATIKEDSVKVYDPFNPFNFYLLGNYNDPVFGNANASIYGQVKSNTAVIIDSLDFTTSVLDSIFLSLVYDTDGFYGKADETYTVSVYRLTEDMDPFSTYYNTQNFAFDPTPLATYDFTPNLSPIFEIINGDTTELPAQVRIPLSAELGNEILGQPYPFDNITKDSFFLDYFKGLYIRAESQTEGILSFDLSSGSSALSIYFTTAEEGQNKYTFSFNSTLAKVTHIEHTFSTEIEDAVTNGFASGDSILYLQALAGPNIQMEFPYSSQLNNTIINKAELEFTISVQDTSDFPSPEQIVITTRDSDGTYLIIDDVAFALSRGITIFGGQVENATSGEARQVYKMNIAGIFQDMADGLVNETLYIRILPKQEQASRVILYGPGHSQYPAKLNLTYTRLNE